MESNVLMSGDVMALRAEMMADGWESEDRITRQGWGDKPGFSIWFKRPDWHGVSAYVLTGHCAVFHAHTSDPSQALKAVQTAAERARLAWRDFPECPPSQGVDGELIARQPISSSKRRSQMTPSNVMKFEEVIEQYRRLLLANPKKGLLICGGGNVAILKDGDVYGAAILRDGTPELDNLYEFDVCAFNTEEGCWDGESPEQTWVRITNPTFIDL